MNTSVLFPPNQEDFSDAIIGSVVQCGEHYHSSNGGRNAGRVSSTSSWFPAAVMKSSWSTAPVPSTHTSDHKRLVSDRRSSDATYSKIQQTTAALVAGDLYAKYMADVEYRRQQNRMHQARYKMRQRKLVADLEDSVNKLKEDIPELEQQHRLLSNKLPSNTSVWGVAAEYFRLFRFGMKGPVSYLTPSRPEDHVQWDFLQTAMAEDVTDGVVLGVQALMDTINYRYRCLDTIDQRPIRMDDGPGNSLTIVIQCDVTITEGMLWYGFPNLVKNEDRSPLADKMLGQKLEIEGSMYLAVDNTTGRVTRLQWKVDLLTPLLRLLGTLNDVSQVFIGARLSAEGTVNASACV
ncbi:hypothetical protein L917_12405 [Phytophthora nicotianae]|uniref:BZIP domain-containing protein n=2 Tax=Phytophthora nicotianae TaxID=4792 RepID=W2KTT0_PHYNI|nr:hypothetical protein L917_12405 [Phytophthora nicotianae]ETM30669.1 hypothetical protein L914_21657 [Phytophthora nicotianae]ETO70452.1 hypothetical protein F444_13061 [Phytophthora nicotianae P1976]